MYVKTNWIDVPDPELATNEPKLNALNLNKIEQGIFDSAEKSALDVANRKIKALFDLTQGQAWDFDRDDNNLYRVPVPSGAKLATVQKYGGKSLVFNQLVQNGNFADTSGWNKGGSGVTFSVSSNIATLKASARYGGIWCSVLIPQGHKFYLTGWIKSSSPSTIRLQAKGVNNVNVNITPMASTDWQVLETLSTHTEDIVRFVVMDIATSGWSDFYCKDCMLIDLTQMFGAGNEPTTVAEVKALLHNDYYAYNIGEIIHADVDKVVEHGRNLAEVTNTEQTVAGITYTPQADGSIKCVGTPTGATAYFISDGFNINETFTIKITGRTNIKAYVALFDSENNALGMLENSSIITVSKQDYPLLAFARIGLKRNTSVETNETVFIWAEKGSTVTTFAPYRHNEYPIPQAIRNLEGYGWSAGSIYNEVDFERKKFIKIVGRVDMGTLTWAYQSTDSYFYTDSITNKAIGATNMLCWRYENTTVAVASMPDKSIKGSGSNVRIFVKDSAYTSASSFKTAMNGVYLYYELAEPVETDISDILEPFNVEDGGTITFHNSNGDGYGIPVPSTEEYLVKLEEVG